jgi:hypothetical protein
MEEAANSIGLKVLTGPEWQGIRRNKNFQIKTVKKNERGDKRGTNSSAPLSDGGKKKKKRQKFHAATNFFFFHPCPVPVCAVEMPYII